MKLVYIAGPYTNRDPWEARQNVLRAEVLGRHVMWLGAWPVIPHSNTAHHFEGSCTPHQAYEGTLEMMRRCDAVLFAPDWADSHGATRERDIAMAGNQPCFDSVAALEAWLRGEQP